MGLRGAARAQSDTASSQRTDRVGGSLAGMSQPSPRRKGRLPAREPKLPGEREWERSALLEPRPAPRRPELISDGVGLPFAPAALDHPPEPLDPEDPAVGALVAYLAARAGVKPSRAPWKRGRPPAPAPSLDGWRLLARTDEEALFGRGATPQLLTIAVRRDTRRGWVYLGASAAVPLRAARDGIRASSWRPDPTHQPQSGDTVLRLLVTEQTFSGGQRAYGRVLAPDMYLDGDQIVLTIFVTPRPGYQAGSSNPETPVRVALPEPLGRRRLIDGALPRLSPPTAAWQSS